MATAYGYCRASTSKQDLTFDVQRDAIEEHYVGVLQPKGYLWGQFFEDRGVSGATPFTERPEGRKLWVTLQPGDCVIWMKMDRASRSVADGARVLEMLAAKRVGVTSLDLGMDMTTPTGTFMANLLVNFGQLERSFISSRTRDAAAALKARGVPPASSIPCGHRRTKVELVPDHDERGLMDLVYGEFMAGKSMEKISNGLFFKGIRRKHGAAYKPEWLIYGLVARAMDYPVMFNYREYTRVLKQHRDVLFGRGREVVLRKIGLAQSGHWPVLSS